MYPSSVVLQLRSSRVSGDCEMQVTMTLPKVESSSDTDTDGMPANTTSDNTPKRTSAIVQPIPRRLLPPSQPVPRFPPPSQTTDDTAGKESGKASTNVSATHEGNSFNSTESSQNDQRTTVCHSMYPGPVVSALTDLSTRRSTAFSVSDLLGRRDSIKTESKMPQPVYQVPVYPQMMTSIAYPTYPSAHMFPPRMDMNIHSEFPKRHTQEEASPTEKPQPRNPSPFGPSRSLTSSPESPKSDTSVSDRSDPNSSTDPEISPSLYKTVMDKKSNRTNYTPMQVRRLEKVFLENPYPEHETYEQLSKELSIPEPRLKVWFQNKRARWKRRAEDKMTQPSVYPFPMMPIGYPYGMMRGTMTSPPESPSHTLPQSIYPYAAPSSGLMMYPGSCYPHPFYPYLQHQMHVQQ